MITPGLLLVQLFNGLQFGITLFLFTAGLTLLLGILNFMNLAHVSLYMAGAYFAVALGQWTGSFWLGTILAVPCTIALAMVVEYLAFRRLYRRDHLDQVLATFGLIMFFNEMARIVWGAGGLYVSVPAALSGNIVLGEAAIFPVYRLLIIGVGCLTAVGLTWLIRRTRTGMLIRAGADKPEMVEAVGIDVRRLFRWVIGLGAGLAALAGALSGPLFSVEPGMGDAVLILALVVIVIGGIGSIRGSFYAAMLVGVVDAVGRTVLPVLFSMFTTPVVADTLGPALGSMLIYLLMIGVLLFKPEGLFAVKER
jgi:branched-chain amino acid transport system permease protein